MACVSDNDLVALLDGTLAPSLRATMLEELAHCTTCRAVLQDCITATAGRRVGTAVPAEVAGYVIGDVLGAGGGGIVVRARDPILD
ncbi:MAG TPA: hypothetical protein VGO00_03895, partial [Kofleriaceae bacterium]|nr:hypothetical protein [Kofleriaceae bacterium]